MSRDEIEAELAADFTPETLSVYADLLLAEGDPRGEVIAIDLRGGAGREAAIEKWLGPLAKEAVVDRGFITRVDFARPQDVTRWFEHPASRYIRGARITGSAKALFLPLQVLVNHSGRWLRELAIHVDHGGVLRDDDAAVLLRAPHLETLEVRGTRALGDSGHPNVKALRVTGAHALQAILYAGETRFPNVTSLDLAFDSEIVLPCLDRLPALRHLDLSRNEPGHGSPDNLGRHLDAIEVLSEQAGRDQLTHLRLPSLRTHEAGARLERLIARMPNLVEVEIARAYRQFPTLILPPIVKQPDERRAWPPLDTLDEQIDIWLGHSDMQLDLLVLWLERMYPALDRRERAAWQRLFGMFDPDHTGLIEVPVSVWREALDTLDDDPSIASWRDLANGDLASLRIRLS